MIPTRSCCMASVSTAQRLDAQSVPTPAQKPWQGKIQGLPSRHGFKQSSVWCAQPPAHFASNSSSAPGACDVTSAYLPVWSLGCEPKLRERTLLLCFQSTFHLILPAPAPKRPQHVFLFCICPTHYLCIGVINVSSVPMAQIFSCIVRT